MRYSDYRLAADPTIGYGHYPIAPSFSREEYALRVTRARQLMADSRFDALVITSSAVGQWFTGTLEPHSWHDRVPSRSTWFILTPDADYLYITPTNNHNLASSRRMTWVSDVREVVERSEWPRVEIWDIKQMPEIFAELGLEGARLGFELGDTMTLGMSFNDFVALKGLLPRAQLDDASLVFRRLMAIRTPFEIDCVRKACQAGQWVHERVADVLHVGMSERELLQELSRLFHARFGPEYAYAPSGGWDVRNQRGNDYNLYHSTATERRYRDGDHVCRGTSGASCLGYPGDIDRAWYLGKPPAAVMESYRKTWESNRAMAAEIKPGARCSDVYMAGAAIERKFAGPVGRSGRRGHGLYNTGGLSVHPDNHIILEPGMIISVEPMFGNDYGFFDLEDQFVVTDGGAECLHDPAPEHLPCIS